MFKKSCPFYILFRYLCNNSILSFQQKEVEGELNSRKAEVEMLVKVIQQNSEDFLSLRGFCLQMICEFFSSKNQHFVAWAKKKLNWSKELQSPDTALCAHMKKKKNA